MEHSILIADDDDSIRFVLTKALEKKGYLVHAARNGSEALACLGAEPIDVVLLDIFMPDYNGLELIEDMRTINSTASIIVMTAHGSTETAIEAAKRRAYDYFTKPFDNNDVASKVSRAAKAADEAKASAEADAKVKRENGKLPQRADAKETRLVGESEAMHAVYLVIGRAAVNDETVLIMGESGTGKELVARAIHENSGRADNEFVVVDCSAIPPALIESALFGHVRGAYTGAEVARQGKFEQANRGTIFLDEIGELPIEVQMKLLRVLQEREVEPVGSNETRQVDVRIVAATNRRLEQSIQDSSFRKDLYYRLNIIPIYLPPLSERKTDIPDLIDFFIARFAEEYAQPKAAISSEAFKRLMAYDWPGNIRELENTLKRALVLCSGRVLLPEHFPTLAEEEGYSSALKGTTLEGHLRTLLNEWVNQNLDTEQSEGVLYSKIRAIFEKTLFEIVLKQTNWNRSKAADILGINRNTLHSKMDEHGIRH
ncbi:MAG: sigma-54 dependent transcriptional regulator [Candidatus Poribacteria bacterium]|nr:sigma-54 dependent transcriptional regulator [Candidatus Poribacteria bacterium]